jgi:hypothetical protein
MAPTRAATGEWTVPQTARGSVHVQWHAVWSSAVEEAFAVLPYDHLMDVEVVRRLWSHEVGRRSQVIAVLSAEGGTPVGVVPLQRRGLASWKLLTQYAQPYARFHVLPGYTDAALAALHCYIACDNVLFHELPTQGVLLRPEESWIVRLSCSYAELMQRTGYRTEDRRCRMRAAGLELFEDRYEELPLLLDLWASKWRQLGHRETASHQDRLLVAFRVLAGQGRLKTFSLYDGPRLVAGIVNLIASPTLYPWLQFYREDYRHAYPGVRNLLATMEWACAHGFEECDLAVTRGEYKRAWAQPEVRGYRLVRGPFGSQSVVTMSEAMRDLMVRVQYRLGLWH